VRRLALTLILMLSLPIFSHGQEFIEDRPIPKQNSWHDSFRRCRILRRSQILLYSGTSIVQAESFGVFRDNHNCGKEIPGREDR
jgi:hypothetical protein